MVLLGFILIATLLSLWLLHDTLTSQESDESSSTTIMNYIYAFINLLDVQSVGEHLIQYEKGGIGSLEWFNISKWIDKSLQTFMSRNRYTSDEDISWIDDIKQRNIACIFENK